MWAFFAIINLLLLVAAGAFVNHEGLLSWWTLVALADALALITSAFAWRFTALYGDHYGWGLLSFLFTGVAIAATVTVLFN